MRRRSLVVWLAGLACAARVAPPAPSPPTVVPSPSPQAPPRPPDRDGDGISDDKDQCPDQPETVNGCRDDDGCPDQMVSVPRTPKFEILDWIFFAAGSAQLRAADTPHLDLLLDSIAGALKENPDLGRFEVQGHADLAERRAARLADARAAAVRAALVARGVSRGLGATMPVCARRDEECPPRNRRVQIIILKKRPPPVLPPAGPHDCYVILASQARVMMPP